MGAKNNRYGVVEASLMRHEIFQRAFSKMAMAGVFLAGATVLGVGAGWWAISHKAEPRYFVAQPDGRITQIVPVSHPYLTNGAITNFAVEAVTNSFTLDFSNYKKELAAASEYYERPDGWNNFLSALKSSGTLDTIEKNSLVSSVVANNATVVQSGVMDGVYTWVVQVSITITYQSASQQSSDTRVAEMVIKRLPTWQTSRGVGISRILLK